jgi:hypothetical protein
MKFVQIDLHLSKAATAVLCRKLGLGKVDIALIQEPSIQGGQIRGIGGTGGTIFSVTHSAVPRSCIYVRSHINALPLLGVLFQERDNGTANPVLRNLSTLAAH